MRCLLRHRPNSTVCIVAGRELPARSDKGDTWVCIAGGMSIANITKANPAIVTVGSSGNYVVDVGCTLLFQNVLGMTRD